MIAICSYFCYCGHLYWCLTVVCVSNKDRMNLCNVFFYLSNNKKFTPSGRGRFVLCLAGNTHSRERNCCCCFLAVFFLLSLVWWINHPTGGSSPGKEKKTGKFDFVFCFVVFFLLCFLCLMMPSFRLLVIGPKCGRKTFDLFDATPFW